MSKAAAAPRSAAIPPVAGTPPHNVPPGAISRRAAIGGILAAAIAPSVLSQAWASDGAAGAGANDTAGVPPGTAVPIPRQNHTATSLMDGRVLVVGGYYLGPLSSVQIYDPGSDTWTDAAPLRIPRQQHTATLMGDGSVLVAGGVYTDPLSSTEIYDPNSNAWSPGAPLEIPRYLHAAAAARGGAMVFGGFYLDRLSSVEGIPGPVNTT